MAIAALHTLALQHKRQAEARLFFATGRPKLALPVFTVQMDLTRSASNAGGTCLKQP